MPLAPLSLAARDYVEAFNLACVAASPTGRIYVSHNPTGASLAWWARANEAKRVCKAARATGDVQAAAERLNVQLTAHDRLVARTTARTERINRALAQAAQDGLLKFFNSEFRRRRLAAQRDGRGFMSYGNASRRLRQAIARCLASGGVISPALVTQVFESGITPSPERERSNPRPALQSHS